MTPGASWTQRHVAWTVTLVLCLLSLGCAIGSEDHTIEKRIPVVAVVMENPRITSVIDPYEDATGTLTPATITDGFFGFPIDGVAQGEPATLDALVFLGRIVGCSVRLHIPGIGDRVLGPGPYDSRFQEKIRSCTSYRAGDLIKGEIVEKYRGPDPEPFERRLHLNIART